MVKSNNKKKIKQNNKDRKIQENIKRQFINLDFENPSLWPFFPRALLFVCIAIGVVVVACFLMLSSFERGLNEEREIEKSFREDYERKVVKAVGLADIKDKLEEVRQYVIQLERQLPSKAEMSALLSDINQAGIGRNLNFELFRPQEIVINDYYAELPISIRVVGKFHDMGYFIADVAGLSRIVTLGDISIEPIKRGNDEILVMDMTARTFRYLDSEEIKVMAERKKEEE